MTRLHSTGQRTGARGAGIAAALALAASLTGCGPAGTGLQRDTARQLQELVLSVSQAAAATDHTTALKTLDSLETNVASAAGRGQVSEERRRSIMASITAVRADLTIAVEATAAAKAAYEATAAAAEAAKTKSDAEPATQTAQESIAPGVPAPVPAPAPEPGKGTEGKGKNNKS